MFNFFVRKKYIFPFIENLNIQSQQNNAIFFHDSFIDGFILMICIKNNIYEVVMKDNLITYETVPLREDSLLNWSEYKKKIMELKHHAKTISSEHLILIASENIRELATIHNLSFTQTKEILNFLLINKDEFYQFNKISLPEDGLHLWID